MSLFRKKPSPTPPQPPAPQPSRAVDGIRGSNPIGQPSAAGPSNPVVDSTARQPLTGPAPVTAESASAAAAAAAAVAPAPAPAATVAGSEEEMIKSVFYALAATCKEAGELYDKCFEKAESSDKFYAISQMEYVNGVQQHEYSKQSFASMARESERELISLLRELRQLATKGRGLRSDFRFLAGGPSEDWMTALEWCVEHDIDSEVIGRQMNDAWYVLMDFGSTMESFVEESNKLYALIQSTRGD